MDAYPNLKAWKPGQSGNLNGRPVGSRTAFSAGFLKDLAEIWSEEGRGAAYGQDKPDGLLCQCARLIGPEVKLTIEQTLPGNLSMEDWTIMREIIASVRQAIPDAQLFKDQSFLGQFNTFASEVRTLRK